MWAWAVRCRKGGERTEGSADYPAPNHRRSGGSRIRRLQASPCFAYAAAEVRAHAGGAEVHGRSAPELLWQ